MYPITTLIAKDQKGEKFKRRSGSQKQSKVAVMTSYVTNLTDDILAKNSLIDWFWSLPLPGRILGREFIIGGLRIII
jgi:hypothetical protein